MAGLTQTLDGATTDAESSGDDVDGNFFAEGFQLEGNVEASIDACCGDFFFACFWYLRVLLS